MASIFSKIILGEIPSEKVFENERIIAIRDISPVAPVHLLIMPKKEYKDLQSVPLNELSIISEIMQIAQQLAHEQGISNNYRLITNNGPEAGQSIFHLHFHLIGGRHLGALA